MALDEFILIPLKLGLILSLVLLNGFFVAAEFSLVKIRDTQLVTMAERGHRRARIARRVVANLDSVLSATQLGITLASLGLGWFAEPVFMSLLERPLNLLAVESPEARHSISFAVGFSMITFLHIVVGELAPKSLAIQKPLPTSLWVAAPMEWFQKISFPFIWVLNGASLWLLRRVGIEAVSESELIHSEEELRLLLAASQRQSSTSALGRTIVLNAFDLSRRIVREVMRPRQEIVGLDTGASLDECLDLAEKTRYSRFPLCENGDPDRTLGVVHVKDLYALRGKAAHGADLMPVTRKIIYVPETCRLEKLLQLCLERRLHLAIVVDEFGGTLGMVTLENILEELVGQIQDEFDQEKPLSVTVAEGQWEISGALPLHDLEGLVGAQLEAENVSTASGFVTQRLGGFPKQGDVLAIGDYDLKVEAMDGMRVERMRVTRRAAVTPDTAKSEFGSS